MKSFLSRLVSRLDIDSGNTRVGLVKYYTSVSNGFNLSDHLSLSSVQSAISSVSYQGGGTSASVALRYVRTTMLTPEAGDRPNVPNVVVVLTDGQSNDIDATKVGISFIEYFLSAIEKLARCFVYKTTGFLFTWRQNMCSSSFRFVIKHAGQTNGHTDRQHFDL